MPKLAPSGARVKALHPRASAYDIRDPKLRGFGIRVMPSGAKRFFIHTQHRGQRIWKIVGDAGTMAVYEARARAVSLLAAIRGDAIRGRRRDCVPAPCARVEAANAVRESQLAAPARFCPGLRECRWPTSSARTCFAGSFAARRATPRRCRPLPAHPVGDSQGGRAPGLPPEGSNPRQMWCKTRSKGLRRFIGTVTEWCRRHRHLPVKVQHAALTRRLVGHFNYFGVNGQHQKLESGGVRHAEGLATMAAPSQPTYASHLEAVQQTVGAFPVSPSAGCRADMGGIATRHISGGAGWWKSPCPDLVRASGEQSPGATRPQEN